MGVYNEWVEKSLQKLAEFIPARYDKPEEASGIVSSLDTYIYEIVRPEQTETAAEEEAVEMEQNEEPAPVLEPVTDAPEQLGEGAQMEQTARR